MVAAHPRGHLFQSWGWGGLRPGSHPHRLAVLDPHRPPAAAQVVVRRLGPFSVCYVPQGPMFSGEPALDSALLAALRGVARRHQALFLHVEPNVLAGATEAGALRAQLRRARFRIGEAYQRSTAVHLDLTPTPDRLLEGLSQGHRRHLRRAEREGVVVRVGTAAADFDAFYAIMRATAARAGFGIFSREYHRRVWELYGERARLLIASLAGAGDVAALLVIGFGGDVQYMFGGANDEGLRSGANYPLHWHAIRWAHERGYARYDFQGVPDWSAGLGEMAAQEVAWTRDWARGSGLHQFKKGWGGDVVRYMPAYDQVYVPPVHLVWSNLWRLRRLGGRLFHP